MLVATPGQTTAYSTTLHNSGNTATAKKSTLTSNTNAAGIGTPKSLINNNHNSSTTSNSTNNIYSQQHHQIHKNDSKNNNNNASTATSKDLNSTKTATHSLKVENSTKPINFIQTLKDSVQKALISTTGICSIANKHNSDNKLQNSTNSNTTTTTSLPNVTSSSSTTTSSSSNNIAKAAATTAVAIATNSANTTASTSSLSLVRNKYSSCSLSKLHTIAPTNLHRYPEDRQQTSSTDSLQKEMCHFKPIRTAPTTPWKSGSKSRGSSLCFPKANIATKKTEFILKSNCDVNNRKKKQQQQQQQPQQQQLQDDHTDGEGEQENKEYYGIYKPKPSSMYLSSSVTTPNHQSAFVCLVAQMKNLVNIQSKKRITSGKVVGRSVSAVVEAGNLELTKTKSTRLARIAKDAFVAPNIVANNASSNNTNKKAKSSINLPVKELFVRHNAKTTNKSIMPAKKVIIPKELIKTTRSTRRLTMLAGAKIKQQHSITPVIIEGSVTKSKPPKTADITKISPPALGITKAKSRRKLGNAKSKIINIVQLATSIAKDKLQATVNRRSTFAADAMIEAKVKQPVNRRKRKISQEDILADASPSPPPTTITSLKPPRKARKSVRLTRDISDNTTTTTNKKAQITHSSSTNGHSRLQRSTVCASPPLTRARLKFLNQELGKVTTVTKVEAKKRKQ